MLTTCSRCRRRDYCENCTKQEDCYWLMEGFAIQEDGTLVLMDECGNYAYCPKGRFSVQIDVREE